MGEAEVELRGGEAAGGGALIPFIGLAELLRLGELVAEGVLGGGVALLGALAERGGVLGLRAEDGRSSQQERAEKDQNAPTARGSQPNGSPDETGERSHRLS
jgi:hydroxymethylglutaryl-CoA reductase